MMRSNGITEFKQVARSLDEDDDEEMLPAHTATLTPKDPINIFINTFSTKEILSTIEEINLENPTYDKKKLHHVFVTAIAQFDFITIAALLKIKADVNTSYDDNSLYTQAICCANPQAALLLLQAGCKLEKDDLAETILMLPSSNPLSHLCVKEILKHGIKFADTAHERAYFAKEEELDYFKWMSYEDMCTKDNYEATPIHYLCAMGNTKILNYIMEKNIILQKNPLLKLTLIETKNGHGDMPLSLAVKNSHLEMTQLLIEKYEAKIHIKNEANHTLLDLADSVEVLKYLEGKGLAINATNIDGETLLHTIQCYPHSQTMTDFLITERGMDIDASNHFGKTPLHIAVEHQPMNVGRLLHHGANIHAKDINGDTPLHLCHSEETAKLLIERGADVNAINLAAQTPLHICQSGRIAKLLLEHKADLNAETKTGDKPLHIVISRDARNQLLMHGADINAENKKMRTALEKAIKAGFLTDCLYFLRKGASVDRTLSYPIEQLKDYEPSADKEIRSAILTLILCRCFVEDQMPTNIDSTNNNLIFLCDTVVGSPYKDLILAILIPDKRLHYYQQAELTTNSENKSLVYFMLGMLFFKQAKDLFNIKNGYYNYLQIKKYVSQALSYFLEVKDIYDANIHEELIYMAHTLEEVISADINQSSRETMLTLQGHKVSQLKPLQATILSSVIPTCELTPKAHLTYARLIIKSNLNMGITWRQALEIALVHARKAKMTKINDDFEKEVNSLLHMLNCFLLEINSLPAAEEKAKEYKINLALHSASSVDETENLLEQGLNPNERNPKNETPLHLAKNVEISSTLIINGSIVNILNDENETPLDYAILRQSLAQVILYIKAGANTTLGAGYGLHCPNSKVIEGKPNGIMAILILDHILKGHLKHFSFETIEKIETILSRPTYLDTTLSTFFLGLLQEMKGNTVAAITHFIAACQYKESQLIKPNQEPTNLQLVLWLSAHYFFYKAVHLYSTRLEKKEETSFSTLFTYFKHPLSASLHCEANNIYTLLNRSKEYFLSAGVTNCFDSKEEVLKIAEFIEKTSASPKFSELAKIRMEILELLDKTPKLSSESKSQPLTRGYHA